MIGIVGAGAFGTALAVTLGRDGKAVTLWDRDADRAARIAETGRTPALPDVALPDAVSVTARIDRIDACETVLLCTPAQSLLQVLRDHPVLCERRHLVACCKGIDAGTLTGPVGIIADAAPEAHAAILTGPSFAADIARGLPTALTLACADTAAGEALQEQLNTATIRIYRSTDTVGAELGGALKNVIAIGCGAAIGAGLGDSARAALMTRGFAEITRFAAARGAEPPTLMGLSGFGDLVLTCTSDLSRNYRYGAALGAGENFAPGVTVEGVKTAQAVAALADSLDIDMPVCRTIAALTQGEMTVAEALTALLTRPLKEE